jgi:hypothetical protein
VLKKYSKLRVAIGHPFKIARKGYDAPVVDEEAATGTACVCTIPRLLQVQRVSVLYHALLTPTPHACLLVHPHRIVGYVLFD